MSQSSNDEQSKTTKELGSPGVDLVKQTRKEMGLDDDGRPEGGRKPWGLEIATLLKSGDIEIFINQFQDNTDDCVCGAPYKIERGTAEYEAALKAHGPLKEGVPHSIRLYPRNETATK